MDNNSQSSSRFEVSKIVATYAIVGCIWIYLSDSFLKLSIRDADISSRLSMYKGLAFITLTSVLLYVLITRYIYKYKLVEERLRQKNIDLTNSEAKLSSYIDKSPDGIYVVDETGRFLEVNHAGKEMVGYTEAELLEMSFPDLLVTESLESALHFFQVVKDTGLSKVDMNYLHKNGNKFWSSVNAVKLSDTRFLAFTKDISDRKYAEDQLRMRELDLEEAQFLAKTGSWTYDPVSKVSRLSKGMCRIWGLDPEICIMSADYRKNHIHMDDYPKFATAFKEAIELNKPYEIELRILRPDGSERTIISICEPVCDETGNVVKIRGTNQDITERKQIEDNLRSSEERFKSYIELSPNAVFVADENGQYVDVNPAASTITGFSKDELLTMKVPDLLPQESQEWGRDSLKQLLETGNFKGEAAFKRKNGEIGYWGLTAVRLSHNSFMGIVVDITNQRQTELDKSKLERQLHQSQKMEAIGQLAGGVAHDFNNKLMAILGNAELAKMDIHDSNKVLSYLDEIRRAAEQSRDITYRLLAFSRQQVFIPQVLDANKILAEILKSLSRLIGEHISISFDAYDKLWNIHMDPVQLDQVVMNLAINARDAMPDGGSIIIETRNITLDVDSCSLNADAAPGDYVLITFSDTGTGMNKETMTHIFEPFFTTKAAGKGTGLGLATIYGIIRQNSGYIDVTSNIGYGTEFKVFIPRFSDSITAAVKIADTLYTGNCSILFVEDEDAVRSVTSLFLKKIGYTVHEAATPRAALELARDLSIRIDLVLTDYVMPEMNGKLMMERILEQRPGLQCIYASGYSTDNVQLSEEAHFIQKPYDFIKLSGVLKQVISGTDPKSVGSTINGY